MEPLAFVYCAVLNDFFWRATLDTQDSSEQNVMPDRSNGQDSLKLKQ